MGLFKQPCAFWLLACQCDHFCDELSQFTAYNIQQSSYMFTELPLASFVLGPGESVVANRVTVQNPHITTGVRGLRPVFSKSPLMEE